MAVAFGETFEALVAGLQGALWALGGVPAVLRSDNLSAATHELKHSSGRELTTRFRAVLEHYGMRSSRITPGRAHENGVAEQAHRRLKAVVAQALLVRGHADFATLAAYEAFVRDVVDRWRNRAVAERVAADRAALRPLPSTAIPSYTIYLPVVRRWSTIRVAHRTYSVPARLMGHTVEARVHADLVEVRYRGQLVQTMPRLRGEDEHRVDYRHVIGWLVRKPGAFARYRYREDLFPSVTFRRAYDALQTTHGERADVEYLRILQLAAHHGRGARQRRRSARCSTRGALRLRRRAERVAPPTPTIPTLHIPAPDLRVYDALLRRSAGMSRPRATRHRRRSDHDACSPASRSRPPRASWCRASSKPTSSRRSRSCSPVLELEADERRERRVARLRRASKLPPGKTFDTLDEGRLPAALVRKLHELARGRLRRARRPMCWRSACPASARATRCAPSATRSSSAATPCSSRRPTAWSRSCSPPNATSSCRAPCASSTTSRC